MGGAANWTEVAVGAAAGGFSRRRKKERKKETDWSEGDLGLQDQDKHKLSPDRASSSSRTRAIVSTTRENGGNRPGKEEPHCILFCRCDKLHTRAAPTVP